MAWEAGALTGLADAGIDIEHWDRVIGTSAGAFVAAHLLGGSLPTLFAAQGERPLDAEIRMLAGRSGYWVTVVSRRRGFRWLPRAWFAGLIVRAMVNERLGRRRRGSVGPRPSRAWPAATAPDAGLARFGAVALASPTRSEDVLRAVVASILRPVVAWPRGLVVTTIDAHDGSLVCVDEASGVPLVDAVAASAALPVLFPPVTIGGRRYIDGGMHSDTNVALAGQVDEVITLVPIDHGGLEREASPLRQRGTRVWVADSGPSARVRLGVDLEMLDPARRSDAARAGYEEGLAAGRAWLARP